MDGTLDNLFAAFVCGFLVLHPTQLDRTDDKLEMLRGNLSNGGKHLKEKKLVSKKKESGKYAMAKRLASGS